MSLENASAEEVLKRAAEKEEEAYQGYTAALEFVTDPGARAMISELAEEEKKHKRLIENLEINSLQDYEIKKIQDLRIAEFLVEKDIGKVDSFQDVLVYAMKREKNAYDFFVNLTNAVEDEKIKKLFEFLANEELKHKNMIETYYDDVVLKDN